MTINKFIVNINIKNRKNEVGRKKYIPPHWGWGHKKLI